MRWYSSITLVWSETSQPASKRCWSMICDRVSDSEEGKEFGKVTRTLLNYFSI